MQRTLDGTAADKNNEKKDKERKGKEKRLNCHLYNRERGGLSHLPKVPDCDFGRSDQKDIHIRPYADTLIPSSPAVPPFR